MTDPLHPVDDADLRWYLCDSAGAMGERSSLGPMIDRLTEGRATAAQSGTPDLPARQYYAARAAAPLRARLAAIGTAHAAVLEATYGPPPPPAVATRIAGLGSGATLPDALVLLIARRQRVPAKKLDAWLRPPPPPPRPDTTDLPPAKVRAALRDHDRATRREHEAWLERLAENLRPLRLAAQLALGAALDAYRGTFRDYPRQPRDRIEAE